jgi:hypothetical protein
VNQQNNDLAALAADVRETRELVEQMHGALEAVATALLGALTPVAGVEPTKPAVWDSLSPSERVAYLLDRPTLPDRAWTREPRLPGENREAFIRRVLAD